MKKLVILPFIAILLIAAFLYRDVIPALSYNLLYYTPCDWTIEYSIGEVDPRFGISESEFVSNASQAAAIWNTAEGKKLLVYNPSSEFKISLVYDVRQGLNTQISQLNNQLDNQNKSLQPELVNYKAKVADFEKRLADFKQQVGYWNSRGGAPQDIYDKLKSQEASLKQEANNLNQLANKLHQTANEYNLNVSQLNQKIDNYNQELSVRPEEGIYVQNASGKKIDIYFNNSKQELIHTLAHEMGHALDVSHVDNKNTVMYPKTNEITVLAPEDLLVLSQACRKRSIFVPVKERIDYLIEILTKYFNNLSIPQNKN